MDTRLPDGFSPDGNSNDSNASGNQIHLYGLSTGMGLAIAALAACALGVSVVDSINNAAARADQRSRYEESYRELSREVRLNTQATDDMRASLIARGINPNNHDVTDVGGAKP
jgi:3-hydroxyacyl-CoA dehydrogenase